ncbi:MAG: hypothetical protein JW969_13875 [Spirochaetales bacterium]|nr:hypothetical protein [Spirochaetales bacterium]
MKTEGKEWTTVDRLKTVLKKKWDSGLFFREILEPQDLFPLRIPLAVPGPVDLSRNFSAVREWIHEYDDADGKASYTIEWKEKKNRVLGQNRIPVAVVFSDLAGVSRFLGRQMELSRFVVLKDTLLSAFPPLKDWVFKNATGLTAMEPVLSRLISVTRWIADHPQPGIYLRQLALENVDTKFVEARRKTIGEWLDILLDPAHIDGQFTGIKGFERRFGFLDKPILIRFRHLAPGRATGGYSDITVRTDEFCRIPLDADRIFVSENDINGLSFPPVPGGIVLFGRGYGFDFLKDAAWLREKEIHYWGDIDTHGFAILSQFRGIFPQTRSFLMDRNTLLSCRSSWVSEKDQVRAMPANLTEVEQELFRDLSGDTYGKAVRLEQELIPYGRVRQVLGEISGV